MKVLIDTNVILDVLYKRESFYKDSLNVWRLCETKQIEGYISALTIPNIVYVLRKELDSEKTLEIIKTISLVFNIHELKEDILIDAAELKYDDYEDALQTITALKLKCEYIITRNIKDFKESKILAIKPCELIEQL